MKQNCLQECNNNCGILFKYLLCELLRIWEKHMSEIHRSINDTYKLNILYEISLCILGLLSIDWSLNFPADTS